MYNPIIPLMGKFQNTDVRFFDKDGNPWFIAKDIAVSLEYANTSQAIRQHCKRAETCPLKTSGQVRHLKIIPQGDVNRLMMRSNKPDAIEIQDWMADVVLPALEKTGTYSISSKLLSSSQEAKMIATYQNQIIKLMDKLKKERNKEARQTLYTMLTSNCEKLNIIAPALNCLGSDYKSLLGIALKGSHNLEPLDEGQLPIFYLSEE